jgi:hypothetical protein
MQDPLACEKMCEQVKQFLSYVFKRLGLRLKSCKIHDYTRRKELMGLKASYSDYKLMRVKITYQRQRGGNKEMKKQTLIVYTCDVARYVRRALDLLEVVVKEKIINNKSYYQLEKSCDFSPKGVKSAIKRVQWAFDRLMPTGIIKGLDMASWLKNEEKSFSHLSLLYREKFYPTDLSLSCIFIK